MIIDGWHRYRACADLGLPCRVEPLSCDDAVAFVLSKNLHRRQLTASQRSAAVVMAHQWKPAHREAAEKEGCTSATLSNEKLAETANVGERIISHTKRAVEAGLGEAVRDGVVSAKTAAEVARLPDAQRTEAVVKHPPCQPQHPHRCS
jgi:hypothetical protein